VSYNVCITYCLLILYSVHKDAVEKAHILHHNMSLLNFLLISWDSTDAEYSWDFVHSSHLSPEAQDSLLRKLEGISRRGHLADWGYAVPFYPQNITNLTRPDNTDTKTTTQPERDTEHPGAVQCQSASLETPLSPLTSLSTPDSARTSPIGDDLDENAIPVQNLNSNGSRSPHYVPISGLRDTHDVTLSMGGDPLMDPCRPSIDTNPLYRTVSSL